MSLANEYKSGTVKPCVLCLHFGLLREGDRHTPGLGNVCNECANGPVAAAMAAIRSTKGLLLQPTPAHFKRNNSRQPKK